LDATNLMDSHNIQSLTLGGTTTSTTIAGTNCGTVATPSACVDPFNQTTPISGLDTPSLMAGRTFSVTATFGFAPRERK